MTYIEPEEGTITLMLSIKKDTKKRANLTFYKYVLLHKRTQFGGIKNLLDSFYSKSFIRACVNAKRALNFG